MEIQRRRYKELSLKTCTHSVLRISVGNENVNNWSSTIARDATPEPVVINLDSDADDSLGLRSF